MARQKRPRKNYATKLISCKRQSAKRAVSSKPREKKNKPWTRVCRKQIPSSQKHRTMLRKLRNRNNRRVTSLQKHRNHSERHRLCRRTAVRSGGSCRQRTAN